MKPLKWGIWGLDCIADEFARHPTANGRAYLAASVDPDKRRRFLQDHPEAYVLETYKALLEDPDADIVYVSTFGLSHYEKIMDCLRHGKHVFCEKAMPGSKDRLPEARALAEEKRLFLGGEAMTIFYMYQPVTP